MIDVLRLIWQYVCAEANLSFLSNAAVFVVGLFAAICGIKPTFSRDFRWGAFSADGKERCYVARAMFRRKVPFSNAN